MSEREQRSVAEWVTFAVSLVIVAMVLALIGLEARGTDFPAAPRAEVSAPIESRAGGFHVPVTVTNNGDETAEQVQVRVSLDIDGEVFEGDQVVDFLAGRSKHDLVFVFDNDPADGELTVQVTGFTVP